MAVLFGSVVDEDEHDTGGRHPERPARLRAVEAAVDALDLGSDLITLPQRSATLSELMRIHTPDYLELLAQITDANGGALDADTRLSAGSYDTARRAAGLGLAAIDALRAGTADAAFVAPRPPGHHAFSERGSGFCLLNNIALAAATLAEDGERVLVVDWDVHHGNGTQAIFWNDPRVLYVSTHQWPWYPGTGDAGEVGGTAAAGLTLNVPLPAGATGDVALHAFDDTIAATVDEFAPTWVLISAGYDAHRDDPLADLSWSAGDYALLTRRVLDFAPTRGRTIAFLEGGYDLPALAESVKATLAVLTGADATTEAPTSGGPGMADVALARRRRATRLDAIG